MGWGWPESSRDEAKARRPIAYTILREMKLRPGVGHPVI